MRGGCCGLGQEDVVGRLCDLAKLRSVSVAGINLCDGLVMVLAIADIDPQEIIENAATSKRRDFVKWMGNLAASVFTGGKPVAELFAGKLYDKLLAYAEDTAGVDVTPEAPSAPSSGGKYKIDPAFLRFQAVKRVVNPNRSVAKVGWVVNNGNAVCTASWPGGSRVLPDRDCNNRKLPPGFEKSGFDTTASGAAAIFSSPRTWMIVGSVAVAGIAGWLILKK